MGWCVVIFVFCNCCCELLVEGGSEGKYEIGFVLGTDESKFALVSGPEA